jgi:hypothetical protein
VRCSLQVDIVADVLCLVRSIFRGWHIDPITMNYKYMIYDDGDECMDDDHYSMAVELVPSSNPESNTKLYGLKKTGKCTFKASLLIYVPEEDRVAAQGIHTPGVVDISDAEASLPVICGRMKCRYGDISKRVRDLSDQVTSNSVPNKGWRVEMSNLLPIILCRFRFAVSRLQWPGEASRRARCLPT